MATITVATHNIENWTHGGSSASLRIYALQQFITSDGVTIAQGNISTQQNYQTVACGVSGTTVAIPEFTLDSTTDSNTPTVKYLAYLYDQAGIQREVFPPDAFSVPHNATSTTWTNIIAYNRTMPATRLARSVYTADQLDVMLQNIVVDYDNLTNLPESIVRTLSDLSIQIGLANASPSEKQSVTLAADITINTPITIPANLIIRRSNGARFIQASTGTLTFEGIGIEDAESTVPLFYDFAVDEVSWTGTEYPPRISTELFDTNSVSLTTRIAIADAALAGKAAVIVCYPRTITDHVTLTEYHHLHFTAGTYANTKSTWGTTYLPAFTFKSNTTITGENAIIELPNNDNNPNLFYGYNSRYGGNHGIEENVTIKDLRIIGTGGTSSAGSHAIILTGNAHNCRVENIHFESTYGYPVIIGGNSDAGYCAENVIVCGITTVKTGTQLISVINGRNVLIDGFHLDLREHNSLSTFAAIDLEPNSSTDVLENITVTNGNINGDVPGTPSVYFTGIGVNTAAAAQANNINISNNMINGRQVSTSTSSEGACIVGVAVEGGFDVTIANNDIRGTLQVAIQTSLSRYVNVYDNVCLQMRGGIGIRIKGTADSQIRNNILRESYTPFGSQNSNIEEVELDFLVTTSGTVATRTVTAGSPRFFTGWNGLTMTVNATDYTVSSINHTTQAITMTSSIGTLTVKSVASATDVNTGTDAITSTAHGFNNGCRLYYTAGTAAIGGLTSGTTYYVVNKTNDTFKLSATLGGSAIDLTTTGTGTQTFTPVLATKFSSNRYLGNDAGDGYALLNTSQIGSTAMDGVITEVADTAYTALPSSGVIVYTSLTAPRTVTLPTAVGLKGKEIVIKDGAGAAATHNITIDGNGSETIDGSSTLVISTNYASKRVKSDGVNWFTVS